MPVKVIVFILVMAQGRWSNFYIFIIKPYSILDAIGIFEKKFPGSQEWHLGRILYKSEPTDTQKVLSETKSLDC